MRSWLERLANRAWYQPSSADYLLVILLSPLSCLFWVVVSLRRFFYRTGLLKSRSVDAFVIVVGNITVGGTGKTPFTLALCAELQAAGISFGVVSRGYGGKAESYPIEVTQAVSADTSGDEPHLIKQAIGDHPVFVGPDRVRAASALLQKYAVSVIVCDDGLQHYALQRDLEFVVVDASRVWGNRLLLPAGPLREPVKRSHEATLVFNGAVQSSVGQTREQTLQFLLQPEEFINLKSGQRVGVGEFLENTQKQNLRAVAGIGNPERFFQTLRELGLDFVFSSFPDHYNYTCEDFQDVVKSDIILMTEKDAVKCSSFAAENMWYLRVSAKLPTTLVNDLLTKVRDYSRTQQQ